ncbi:hypothetical protein [Cryobacterium zongtaii]|nr:hypothetical protein [Cryobacterium zongtaii]
MFDAGRISLTDAYSRYELEGGQRPLSSWRARVREHSNVDLGAGRQFAEGEPTTVRAEKVSGRWFVDETGFTAALNETALARAELDSISVLYEQHELLGGPQDQVKTTWGWYIVSSPFHERYDPIAEYHRGSGSQHVCNACWAPVVYEHNQPECHRCRDWSPCGRNCTRSAMICLGCNARVGL